MVGTGSNALRLCEARRSASVDKLTFKCCLLAVSLDSIGGKKSTVRTAVAGLIAAGVVAKGGGALVLAA
jgi:hypothetical protein